MQPVLNSSGVAARADASRLGSWFPRNCTLRSRAATRLEVDQLRDSTAEGFHAAPAVEIPRVQDQARPWSGAGRLHGWAGLIEAVGQGHEFRRRDLRMLGGDQPGARIRIAQHQAGTADPRRQKGLLQAESPSGRIRAGLVHIEPQVAKIRDPRDPESPRQARRDEVSGERRGAGDDGLNALTAHQPRPGPHGRPVPPPVRIGKIEQRQEMAAQKAVAVVAWISVTTFGLAPCRGVTETASEPALPRRIPVGRCSVQWGPLDVEPNWDGVARIHPPIELLFRGENERLDLERGEVVAESCRALPSDGRVRREVVCDVENADICRAH